MAILYVQKVCRTGEHVKDIQSVSVSAGPSRYDRKVTCSDEDDLCHHCIELRLVTPFTDSLIRCAEPRDTLSFREAR